MTEEQRRRVALWCEQQESGHVWWSYQGIAICSERPSIIARDQRGRLHSDTGPALAYRDGYSIWSIHGVRCDRKVIDGAFTVEEITTERNAEIRRVMLGKFGEANYLEAIGAKCIHKDERGELFRAELEGDEPLTMVRVINSTPEPEGHSKVYWLRVHPQLRPMLDDGSYGKPQAMTAHNAVASTFGLTGSKYNPSVET